MTAKQKARAEEELLQRVLARIRRTTREEWMEQLASYEKMDAEARRVEESWINGTAPPTLNGHKSHVKAKKTEILAAENSAVSTVR